MRLYEKIADNLVASGVRQCFGLIGEDVAELVVALRALDVQYYSSRHEANAVAMADGYARTTGRLGVVVLSKGPGLLNGLSALVTAARAGSTLLVIVADTDADESGAARTRKGKYLDQHAVLSAIGVRTVTPTSAACAPADLAKVLEHAELGNSIVFNVADRLFAAEAGDLESDLNLQPKLELVPPKPGAISDVADLIEATFASSRPVILAGRGAVRSEAKDALEELGAITGSLMATTLLANGMFSGNPFDLGIMGTFSNPAASDLLSKADLLLVFGASLGLFTTYNGELAPRARVVQFDADPSAFGLYPFAKPELEVQGDLRLAVDALLAELERRGHNYEGYRSADVAELLAGPESRPSTPDESDEEGLDPRAVMRAIDALLPVNRVVITDNGHHMNFSTAAMRPLDTSSWIYPCDFSAIGSGTGVAVGAAIARPERLTVLCVGDGGLMMTIGELATAVRYELPLLIVVDNDAAYGSDLQLMKIDGVDAEVARNDSLSFEAIGKAMGAEGMTVKSLGDIAALKTWLSDPRGPMVVDCKITTSVQADSLRLYRKLGRQSGR